jgi:hypothetical protein
MGPCVRRDDEGKTTKSRREMIAPASDLQQ